MAKTTATTELNLFQKLLAVKKQVPYIKKDARGYNFNYANPEAVLGELNPLLNEAGVLLKSEVLNSEMERLLIKTKNGEKYENLYRIKMRMTWVNVDNPEERDVNEWYSAGINGEEQGYGSALTYGERYFMLKYFNIATGMDDPDAQIERAKEKAEAVDKKERQRNYTIEAENCKTLKELGTWWQDLSTKDKKLAEKVKENRKSEIMASEKSKTKTNVEPEKQDKKALSLEERAYKSIEIAVDLASLTQSRDFINSNEDKLTQWVEIANKFNEKADQLGLELSILPF